MNKLLSLTVLMLLLAKPAAVFAHSSLAHATPGMGEVIEEAPTTLELHFSAASRLVNVTITDENGKPVKLESNRVMTEQEGFSLPLPMLEPGSYTVHWTIMGGDSHKMSGSYEFTIL